MRALPLADELFLIGHNEYSGKCLANTDAVDLGLAGAVLGELLLSDRIAVVDGRVLVRDPRPYQDRVTDAALAELLRQREAHPPRAWVEYLSEDVRDIVGQRLASINLVRREQSRTLTLRSVVRYPAVDAIEAASPRVRLRYLLDHNSQLDLGSALLASLVRATELDHVLLMEGTRQQVRDHLGRIAEALPADLRALSAAVDAAVAAVALTVRR